MKACLSSPIEISETFIRGRIHKCLTHFENDLAFLTMRHPKAESYYSIMIRDRGLLEDGT